jgi:hypothetical protein
MPGENVAASGLRPARVKEAAAMLDRQKIEAILRRRFPGADATQVAAATNAVIGMGDEWEELAPPLDRQLIAELAHGTDLRVFRRRAD